MEPFAIRWNTLPKRAPISPCQLQKALAVIDDYCQRHADDLVVTRYPWTRWVDSSPGIAAIETFVFGRLPRHQWLKLGGPRSRRYREALDDGQLDDYLISGRIREGTCRTLHLEPGITHVRQMLLRINAALDGKLSLYDDDWTDYDTLKILD